MLTNNLKNSTTQGFTLIETFVAITILMITIVGPMSIISKFYADSNYVKNQISASFLTQDGMETVQNIIKNNSAERRQMLISSTEIGGVESFTTCRDLASEDWLKNLSDYLDGFNVTSVDSIVSDCDKEKGCSLKKNTNGYYIASTDNTGNSIFTRKIVISPDSEEIARYNPDGTVVEGDESNLRRSAQVTSSVWWLEKGVVRGPVVVSSLIMQNQCP